MRQSIARRSVVVAGVGLHPFGRFPEKSTEQMVQEATQAALADAGVGFGDVEIAYYAHMYYQGASPGERFLAPFGLTGIPMVNVENACSSGTTAIWQAYWAVATGQFDCALVVGSERVPRGPVAVTAEDDPQRFVGDDHMMATYALRMRRYIASYGAPVEAIAGIAVKAHRNAVHNPYAQYKKEFTLDDVLGSRMIAEPLTLYQCCPTSEGAAAAVLVAEDALPRRADGRPTVYVRAAALTTERYHSRGIDNPDSVAAAAEEAFRQAGISAREVDLVQVHDAATIGEVLRIESLGLVPKGEGWAASQSGATALGGELPVNTDGGLLAMGHPFGASGIRMLHETVVQIRGLAGPRQVKDAKTGLVQCSGAGGVCTVIIASR
ncbi:MAG: thiolase family protein [Chloroflexi bacterium]|nr:thiolase family protein [Chloroflexota bacterium]